MDTKEKPLKKRTWCYIHPPEFYECYCNNGGKINQKHRTTWSEFEGMIWCYDCKLDMRGFGGIFDGPVPYQATRMLMGKTVFYRINMEKNTIEYDVLGRSRIYYRTHKALTKKYMQKQRG